MYNDFDPTVFILLNANRRELADIRAAVKVLVRVGVPHDAAIGQIVQASVAKMQARATRNDPRR